MLRRLRQAGGSERNRLVSRLPVVADLALVAHRTGVWPFEIGTGLADILIELVGHKQRPIVSSLEAYFSDFSRAQSFMPVVYVDDPLDVPYLTAAGPSSPRIGFLLPTTDNVQAESGALGGGVQKVSPEWALLDSLASPGRQPDASLFLLDDLIGVRA